MEKKSPTNKKIRIRTVAQEPEPVVVEIEQPIPLEEQVEIISEYRKQTIITLLNIQKYVERNYFFILALFLMKLVELIFLIWFL